MNYDKSEQKVVRKIYSPRLKDLALEHLANVLKTLASLQV